MSISTWLGFESDAQKRVRQETLKEMTDTQLIMLALYDARTAMRLRFSSIDEVVDHELERRFNELREKGGQ